MREEVSVYFLCRPLSIWTRRRRTRPRGNTLKSSVSTEWKNVDTEHVRETSSDSSFHLNNLAIYFSITAGVHAALVGGGRVSGFSSSEENN